MFLVTRLGTQSINPVKVSRAKAEKEVRTSVGNSRTTVPVLPEQLLKGDCPSFIGFTGTNKTRYLFVV